MIHEYAPTATCLCFCRILHMKVLVKTRISRILMQCIIQMVPNQSQWFLSVSCCCQEGTSHVVTHRNFLLVCVVSSGIHVYQGCFDVLYGK
jgi:hypothetical protein